MTRHQVWKARERARFWLQSEAVRKLQGRGNEERYEWALYVYYAAESEAMRRGIGGVFV